MRHTAVIFLFVAGICGNTFHWNWLLVIQVKILRRWPINMVIFILYSTSNIHRNVLWIQIISRNINKWKKNYESSHFLAAEIYKHIINYNIALTLSHIRTAINWERLIQKVAKWESNLYKTKYQNKKSWLLNF